MNSFFEFVDGLKEKQLIVFQGIKELIRDMDAKRLSCNAGTLALGIFLSRCGIKDAIYPFGQAFFVCMLMYSAYYKVAFVGCLIGWVSLFPGIPYSGMLVSAVCMAVPSFLERRYRVERTRLIKVIFVIMTLIGVLMFNINGRYFAIVGISEAVVSIFCMFIYDKTANALFVHKKRSRLTDDEAICLVFCLCTLVIFAGGMKIYNFEVGLIIAGILTMGFGYIFGGTVGAAAGVICGLCVSLGGGSIYTIGSMGVCGFFSGVLNKHGRILSIIAYIITNVLLTIYINGSSFVILPIQNTLISGLVVLSVPKPIVEKARELLCNTLGKSREERYYVDKYNSLAKEKISSLAGLFKTMSELFFTGSQIKNCEEAEVGGIIRVAADVSCKSCIKYKQCWQDEFLATFGGFEALIEDIVSGDKNGGKIDGCISEDRVIKSLREAIDGARLASKEKLHKDEGKELLGEQLSGVSSLLTNLNSQINSDVRFESEIERNIRDELVLFDVGVRDVCVMNLAGSYRCQIEVNGCGGNLACKHKIQKTVSKFCGKPMVMKTSLCASGKSGRCKLEYEMSKPLKVSSFVVQSSKEEVCGDSYKIGYISDGEYMLCLSDGMGSGSAAREESRSCVDLLNSFFKAGFSEKVAFSTVNKLLILKSDTEIFTTVDLCMVNLVKSQVCFTKIGAVPSVLIKRSKGAYVIRGDSLPLGILDEVNEKSFQMDVESGDILIMFTDGIYDTLCGLDGNIDKIISEIAGGSTDIREISSQIMERCKVSNGGENKDDMTILISMFKTE